MNKVLLFFLFSLVVYSYHFARANPRIKKHRSLKTLVREPSGSSKKNIPNTPVSPPSTSVSPSTIPPLSEEEEKKLLASPSYFMQISPTLTVLAPTFIQIPTNNYSVLYQNTFAGMLAFQITFQKPYLNLKKIELSNEVTVGWGSRSSSYDVITLSTGADFRSTINLMWVPISFGQTLAYQIPSISSLVKLYFGLGVGGELIHQSTNGGPSDLEVEYYAPFAYALSGISFFDKQKYYDWFGGFNFRVSFFSTFLSQAILDGLSYDLSFNILL